MSAVYISISLARWQFNKIWIERNLRQLRHDVEETVENFSPDRVTDLPEPVQRYFLFSIQSGSKLHRSAELELTGTFCFGEGKAVLPLRAKQVHCAPRGMVWKANIGSGVLAFSGTDGVLGGLSWTLFALHDLFPIVQIRNNPNHYQSAVGRMLAETIFWSPAALLVSLPVTWQSKSENEIKAIMQHGDFKTEVDIKLKDDGCPLEVCFQRWSDANPAKKYRYQPFGGYLSEFKEFDGIKIPTRIEAGNFFGTESYFPFYQIDVKSFTWLD